jgi:hypothetical protein
MFEVDIVMIEDGTSTGGVWFRGITTPAKNFTA